MTSPATPAPASAAVPAAERDCSRLGEPARRVVRAVVTRDPLDVQEHASLVADAAAGAVVTFSGVVRDHDHGRPVERLEYLGHPSAADVLLRVAQEVAERFPVDAVAVSHRVGPLAIGECALAVAVSAAHRHQAFEAAGTLVDEVKRQVPIWKHQHLGDGSAEWVACP